MRQLFFVLFCLLGAVACADEMRLALLQPRVAEGSDPCKTIEISMVRGELRKAFGWQSDFQVLTRTDVDAMLEEQGFQQSGLVDDAQRQKVGVMTGAQYMCVSTITKDGTQLYIEAYLVNVATGQMTNPATQYVNIKDGDHSLLPASCNDLAKEMLGEITGTQHFSSSPPHTANVFPTNTNTEFIDLGLPSGTLWKEKDEDGFYSYEEALSKFSNNLPSKEQLEELKKSCQWTWIGNGYRVVGPNRKSIILPAAGWRYCSGEINNVGTQAYFWSCTPYGSAYTWTLNFTSGGIFLSESRTCAGRSVRLVR